MERWNGGMDFFFSSILFACMVRNKSRHSVNIHSGMCFIKYSFGASWQ